MISESGGTLVPVSAPAEPKKDIRKSAISELRPPPRMLVERLYEHIGQLNTYVTWYRKHMMAEGDKPPVGLLLCTGKDHAFVEYALAAMDNRLFVSKYQLELPARDELIRFLDNKRRELNGRHGEQQP